MGHAPSASVNRTMRRGSSFRRKRVPCFVQSELVQFHIGGNSVRVAAANTDLEWIKTTGRWFTKEILQPEHLEQLCISSNRITVCISFPHRSSKRIPATLHVIIGDINSVAQEIPYIRG